MKSPACLALLAMLALAPPAAAQSRGDRPVRIAAPGGLTFTRSLNGAGEGARVDRSGLTLAGPGGRDNFRDPDSTVLDTAPILLAPLDNGRPFTFTARVSPGLHDTYDAGALFLWASPTQWVKLALELDERHKARIVTVRTNGTSDDNNHDVVTRPSVSMKISSNAKTIAFYYSLDGTEWQLVRLFRNDLPAKMWIGVSAQSPKGKGSATRFEGPTLTPGSVRDFRLGR